VREVVGTGVQRTDIPMRELTAVEHKHVAVLLRRLGIGPLADRRFLTLSYGERRLVLIARALASRPKLLLLDEVANGLDARNHARFLAWLNGTARSSMPGCSPRIGSKTCPTRCHTCWSSRRAS